MSYCDICLHRVDEIALECEIPLKIDGKFTASNRMKFCKDCARAYQSTSTDLLFGRVDPTAMDEYLKNTFGKTIEEE